MLTTDNTSNTKPLWLYILGLALIFVFVYFVANWLKPIVCGNELEPLPGNEAIKATLANACNDSGECPHKVILVRGQIVAGSSKRIISSLQLLLDENPSVKTICVDSPGGDNESGYALGKFIAGKSELTTCLAPSYKLAGTVSHARYGCHSMCPWVYLAGSRRIALGTAVTFDFHATTNSLRICSKKLFEQSDRSEEGALAAYIKTIGEAKKLPNESVSKHLALLKWSFDQGGGQTVPKSVIELFEKFDFVTEIDN